MGMKTCPCCKQSLPKTVEFFYFYSGKPHSYCRDCCKAMGRASTWSRDNKARKNDINRAWRARNKDRRRIIQKASSAVFQAVKTGRLVRPETCCKCGRTGKIEAAHTDYDKLLDVIWLCRSCHRAWDSNEPKSLNYHKTVLEPIHSETGSHKYPTPDSSPATPL